MDQIGIERRVQRHLDAQVPQQRRAVRGGVLACGRHHVRDVQPAAAGHSGDVDVCEVCLQFVVADGLVGDEIRVHKVLLDDDLHERQQQIHVGAGADAQVPVGLPRRFRDARIDDDHCAGFVAREAFERVGRIVAAVADVRVGAHDQQEVGVVVVRVQHGARRTVEHPVLHHPMLRLLLGEGIEEAARLEQRQKGHAVRRVEVVGLAADADQPDRPRRVCRNQRAELGRNVAERLVPTHLCETSAGFPFEWMTQALGVVHVVVHAEPLVADVTVRNGAGLVGADVLDVAVHEIDRESAVVAAQHAHRGLVACVGFDGPFGNGRIDVNR